MNYEKRPDGKIKATLTLDVEVPQSWLEHCASVDVFRRDYSGYWAQGVEFDPKFGWLVLDEQDDAITHTGSSRQTNRAKALRAWRGPVDGAVVRFMASSLAYAKYNGQDATVCVVYDVEAGNPGVYEIVFGDGEVLDAGEDELIIEFPNGWYRLDEAAAVRAYLAGVRRWGEKWDEHQYCDGRWYDIAVQLALLGEVRYG